MGSISPQNFQEHEDLQGNQWFFLGGAIAPIIFWLAAKAFPLQWWIRLIKMPILIAATGNLPPVTTVNDSRVGLL